MSYETWDRTAEMVSRVRFRKIERLGFEEFVATGEASGEASEANVRRRRLHDHGPKADVQEVMPTENELGS